MELSENLPALHGGTAGYRRNEDRLGNAIVARELDIQRLTNERDELLTQLMCNAPDCWEDFEPQGQNSMAVAYVRSLEGEGDSMAGHTDECQCFGGAR